MPVPFFQTVKSFAQFLANWTLKGGKLVDQETANARAAICASCHNNSPSAEVRAGCGACRKGGDWLLDKVRNPITGGRRTPSDPKLKVCALCGCDLKIKVWIPNEALGVPKEEANAYPSFCWRKAMVDGKEIL